MDGIPLNQALAIPVVVVLAGCFLANVTDVREFKIRNTLTMSLIVAGLAFHGLRDGLNGLAESACGLAVGFAILFVPYVVGVMGGGDVKLMAAVGAWLGAAAAYEVAVVGCLAAGVYSTVVLIRQNRLGDSWTAMIRAGRWLRRIGRHAVLKDEPTSVRLEVQRPDRRRRLIPFSLMITVAVLVLLTSPFWPGAAKAAKVKAGTNSIQQQELKRGES